MKYANQYLQSAIRIIEAYDGVIPLALFLKKYFSENKKFGSKDRKNISHLCYAYYRLGHAGVTLLPEQKIRIAVFLMHESEPAWQSLYEHSWVEQWNSSWEDKIAFVQLQFPCFQIKELFPWQSALTAGIDPNAFVQSFFTQPDLFLRIRPGKEKAVIQKLSDQQIHFKQMGAGCLSLANASKLEAILEMDTEVVVQDASSQKIGDLLALVKADFKKRIQYWDCCAASGGKTILAADILGDIEITVSDIRHSILHNLTQRFQRAGIKHFHPIVADLSVEKPSLPQKKFQLIHCDAPCTGSGTWGRTPEQLSFFKPESLAVFVTLQQSILRNTLPLVEKGGYYLFSTCSVFQAENEANKTFILSQNSALEVVSEMYLQGYDKKADSMYAVLFKNKLN